MARISHQSKTFFELMDSLLSINHISKTLKECQGFPGGSDSKKSVFSAGNLGWIPGLRRSPGGENGNPLQYSCLKNSMDRGDWRATVHRAAKSQTQLIYTLIHTLGNAN